MNQSLQEQHTAQAFGKQSAVFDEIDEQNKLLVWMRNRVHQEVMDHISRGAHLLELNCGSGIDALFFAQQGIQLTATDNALGMLDQLNEKIAASSVQNIRTVLCSFNHLSDLGTAEKYDYIFSNFGGLNCTDRLDLVLDQMDLLLKPGGRFTLVIMPRICPWELLLVFKGYFKTALRRLKKGGVSARVEGVYFNCYYYTPDYLIQHLNKRYNVLSLKSLGLAIPPPYIQHFVEKYPRLFRFLERWENKWCSRKPFNQWGDHFMITMQKN